MADDIKAKALPYALANAVKFNGKAAAGSVMSAVIGAYPELKADMKSLAMTVNAIIKEITPLGADRQKTMLEGLAPQLLEKKESTKRIGLPELPNVPTDRKVKMRIAPYPSGPLHIGNAKQLVINDEYVKKYDGTFVLFYDDTIGSEEKNISPEAYELIKDGALWLGCTINEEYKKSDRMDIYYQYALELIKKGKAYVCTCDSETLRGNREKGMECLCRKHDVEKVINDWTAMLLGSFEEGKAALRIKTDMRHPNPAFRDRVLFRICKRIHPLVGDKYIVWPLLEFSWAIDDHLIGMTHIVRGKDLMMETDMERYLWDIFGWPNIEVIHTGLMRVEGAKISKSKSKQEVISGKYAGWDDPRTWSLQSLRRRGIQPKAVRDFCLAAGINANEITVPVDNLYSENRKLIDLSSNRYFFVQDPLKIDIKGAPELDIHLELHPEVPEKGHRRLVTNERFYISQTDHDALQDGLMYRLMDCLNFSKEHDCFSFVDTSIDTYRKNGKKIMHWLPAEKDSSVDVEVLMEDGAWVKGKGEKAIANLKPGTIVQFERFGFCRIDAIENVHGSPVVKCWFTHK